jgi:hypothetical protein
VIPRWGKLYKENPQTSCGSFFICPPSQSHAGSMIWAEAQTKNPAEAGFGDFLVARTCEISNQKILQDVFKVIDFMENM